MQPAESPSVRSPMPVPSTDDRSDSLASESGMDYIISGLNVRSALELPSAICSEQQCGEPDVTIAFGVVPVELPQPDRSGTDWSMAGDRFLIHLPGSLRALMTGGRSMVVQLEAGQSPGDYVLYLLGTCFAVLLQQRGRVVLHASAVAVNGRAMLFCGHSGAGKSTLAALLEQRGYPLLNDDVCNLSLLGGEYVIYPDGRMLKLWSESMAHLQRSGEAVARVRPDLEKFYAAPERVDLTPRTVGGVYILQQGERGTGTELVRLNHAESLAELTRNAYRPALVRAMDMLPAYFQACIAMQRRAGVYRLTRALDFSRAGETIDVLEGHWKQATG